MSFLNPAYLWLLPLISVPTILHFINRQRPKRIVFSYIKILRDADKTLMPKKRLKEFLLLLVRTLLLLFLVLFFARPIFQSPSLFTKGVDENSLVVLVDVSASMGLVVSGQTTLDLSKMQIQNLLKKVGPDTRVGLVAFSDQVELELAPTVEKSRISAAIGGLALKPRSTDVQPALLLAAQMLSNQPKGKKTILIVSDQASHAWQKAVGESGWFEGYDPDTGVILWEAVDDKNNAGISQASLVLGKEGVLQGEWNTHGRFSKDKKPSWELILNDRIVSQGVMGKDVRSGDSISLSAQLPEGGYFAGTLQMTQDSLSFDDTYYLAGRVPKGFRLLIVEGERGLAPSDSETYFLRLALENPRDPRLKVVQVIVPESLPQEDLSLYDVIVLANTGVLREESPKLIRWVEEGGGLLVAAGGNWPKPPDVPLGFSRSQNNRQGNFSIDVEKLNVKQFAGLSGIKKFEWGQVSIHQYFPLAQESTAENLLMLSTGDPLLLKKKIGKGTLLYWTTTVDRSWSNFPAKPVFAPLFRELLASLADPLREQTSLMGFVDKPLRIQVPPGLKQVSVLSPDGTSAGVSVTKDGSLEWAKPQVPGLYQVRTNQAGKDFYFAVNIPRMREEGNLERIQEGELESVFPDSSVAFVQNGPQSLQSVIAILQGKDLTTTLIWLVLVLLGLETLLGWPKKGVR